MGMQPKATLEDKFNDDYEPVRCQVMSGMAAPMGIPMEQPAFGQMVPIPPVP